MPMSLTDEYLQKVLKDHEQWWSEARPGWKLGPIFRNYFEMPNLDEDPRRANLCNAILFDIQLPKVVLAAANLSYVGFEGANLNNADLTSVNLVGAMLPDAKLRKAALESADLRRSDLSRADASEANFRNANLSGAKLSSTNLSGASLWGADLSNAFFEPAPGQLPTVDGIAESDGLSTLQYKQPRALVNLRSLFKDAGYREQERQITYALRHGETENQLAGAARLEGIFNYVLFELTTLWGLAPGRALVILMLLIPIFAIPYLVAIWMPSKGQSKVDGVWQVWPSDRLRDDLGTQKPTRLSTTTFSSFGYAFYFSLLSAFHIGWRDLNVGNWIARIQPREYTLRASGWVRAVSGIQSLISVYLLAIWALTYFGRPFE